jgi:hypothetical protein
VIYQVEVAVALSRPPAVHEWRTYRIEARDATDAKVIALQMASCKSVMPVYISLPVRVAEIPDPDVRGEW